MQVLDAFVALRIPLLLMLAVGGILRGWALGLIDGSVPPARHSFFDLESPPCDSIVSIEVSEDFVFFKYAKGLQSYLLGSARSNCVRAFAWDQNAIVYVASGADGAPGVAGVDDDGNGVVDDASELGATSSDDLVLTPTDPGYQDADSGKVQAIVLSRGAMVPAPRDVTINGPTQIRIDVVNDKDQLISKIIDLK